MSDEVASTNPTTTVEEEEPTASGNRKIDMNGSLEKARAIAAKLGSLQKPPPTKVATEKKEEDTTEEGNVPTEVGSQTAQEFLNQTRQQMQKQREARRRRSASPSQEPPSTGRKRARSGSRSPVHDQTPMPIAEFPVPANMVGLIIGRGGSNLRLIEQQHGVRIQFDSNHDRRSSGDRKVTVEGPVESARGAQQEIMEFIKQHQQQQGGESDMPVSLSQTIMVPNSKVGLVIGRGGESIREIQASTGARVQIQQEGGRGPGERPVQLMGTQMQIDRARDRIMEIVSGGPASQQQQQQQQQQQPLPPQNAGGMYGSQMGSQRTEEMQIPATSVGIIIGRGGETIKYLQQSSGARIQILQDQQYSMGPMRPVTISGDPQSCMRARRMIEEKLQSVEERKQQQPTEQQPTEQQPVVGNSGYNMQWTNKQTFDYYSQYAAAHPEYQQYAEYYRELAISDPNGIVPNQ